MLAMWLRPSYRVHLDCDRGSGLDAALGSDSLRAPNIASDIVAVDIRHRAVTRGHANALGSVLRKLAASIVVTVQDDLYSRRRQPRGPERWSGQTLGGREPPKPPRM